MPNVSFHTANPCDHVARALDLIRKMGFTLRELQVCPDGRSTYRVELTFQTAGDLTTSTLVKRIEGLVGVWLLACHDQPAGWAAHEALA